MKEAVLILLLIAVVGFAVYMTARKLRKGGGCCGEHETAEKRVAVRDKNRAHYPFTVQLHISGMTCENCARRVENALNALDGTWAKVDLGRAEARVLCKTEPDLRLLCQTVAQAGYGAGEL